MRVHVIASIVMVLLLIIVCVASYSVLANSRGWELYALWTLFSILSLIAAWIGVDSWRRELS